MVAPPILEATARGNNKSSASTRRPRPQFPASLEVVAEDRLELFLLVDADGGSSPFWKPPLEAIPEGGWRYLEVVAEGALLVEGGDEPELGLQVVAALLGAHELQDVVVVELRQFEDLLFGQPRLLVLQREDLDGHRLRLQLALPHGAEAAARLDLDQLHRRRRQRRRRRVDRRRLRRRQLTHTHTHTKKQKKTNPTTKMTFAFFIRLVGRR